MLTDTDREMLDFAGLWWKSDGLKEQAIRDRFGISPTRFYQRLNRLIDHPEALVEYPSTVNRLRRVRGRRRAAYRTA